MKFLLAIVALATTLSFSQSASAQAGYNDISTSIGTGGTNQRKFYTGRTASSLGCTIYSSSTTNCPANSNSCYRRLRQGWNPTGYVCCTESYICRDGEPAQDLIDAAEAAVEESSQQDSLANVFDANVQTISYWGYINSSNRSPSSGRTAQAPAHLDTCMGSANVDSYTASLNDCYTACDDSTKNGYCTASGFNNGSSTTAATCKDRCDCVLGGTCENK